MSESKAVELFGGALSCKIPSQWRDVSLVRQVPDNQEVYQDCTENTGAVLVIEILEHQSDVSDEEACSFFFRELADANGCSCSSAGKSGSVMHESQVVKLLLGSGQNRDDENETVEGAVPSQWKRRSLFPGIVINSGTVGCDNNTQSKQSEPIACCIMRGSQKVAQGKDTDASGRARDIKAKWIRIELCALRLTNVDVDLLITMSTPQLGNAEENDNDECLDEGYSDVFRDLLESLNIRDWSLFGG